MGEPNVLLLDEPTNDLDIETLTSVEDLLDGFAGTVVVVSHDRYFLERVCDRVVGLLGDGRVRDLPGGVDEYLALRASSAVPATAVPRAAPGPAADRRQVRKELVRLERRLERLATEEKRLHDELASHASDHQRVLVLDQQLRELLVERHEVEEQWLELAED
jgi:ATP-binding cassette subfamily F protein uup